MFSDDSERVFVEKLKKEGKEGFFEKRKMKKDALKKEGKKDRSEACQPI